MPGLTGGPGGDAAVSVQLLATGRGDPFRLTGVIAGRRSLANISSREPRAGAQRPCAKDPSTIGRRAREVLRDHPNVLDAEHGQATRAGHGTPPKRNAAEDHWRSCRRDCDVPFIGAHKAIALAMLTWGMIIFGGYFLLH